ncbi:ATP-binding protein [Thermodesulfobacteriota bacterium]
MEKSLKFHNRLSFRLVFWVGLILLISMSGWALFDIRLQEQTSLNHLASEADRLGNTIKLGTHYAMMLNSRNDINQIITNISRQKDIEKVRIYNKEAEIKFSNRPEEVDQATNIKAEACDICHHSDPPLETIALSERTRIFESQKGYRLLGIISPIYNESGCSGNSCHVHPADKKVLGALDVVISLDEADQGVQQYKNQIIGLTIFIFLGAAVFICFFLLRFVNRPLNALIKGTRLIAQGEYGHETNITREDEIGELAVSINEMGQAIQEHEQELNKQKKDYQDIFELAPCYITVQDRNFRLIRFNREFAEEFDPRLGDYCYQAYKGRSEKCERCPVEGTFTDGKSHYSEEMGVKKDGTPSFWVVRTSPIRNSRGEVTAAMEMCLDITPQKLLEKEVKKSEEKYRTIFNNIPNPVFILDRKTFEILDCNANASGVYGFDKKELLGLSFLNLFEKGERDQYASELISANILNQVRQVRKVGDPIYADIHISSSEYLGQEALLITTSDITQRLMAEQQLIQASKMATLGEMATGVAHELNQPLTVIKTASSFLLKKVRNGNEVDENILKTLSEEIESHVDRATKIIGHMREFGRKSDVEKEKVQVNDPLKRALEIFSQQLKLREIEVVEELDENIPPILADANRLEQVFINLLINARDSIEEKWEKGTNNGKDKKIFLKTSHRLGMVHIEIKDTGTGIPDSIRDKIFQPFFTSKEVGKGTGLGLSISYGIVQDYHGSIKVETQEGKGSSFIIRFPTSAEV